MSIIFTVLMSVAMLFLAAACTQSPAPAEVELAATVSALSTANAELVTQVADLSAAAGLPTPTPAPVQETEPPVSAAPAGAEAGTPTPVTVVQPRGDGPLPSLAASVSLAPAGETIFDLRVDSAANRIYASDTAGQLHVLDATTYQPVALLPFGGRLELDPQHKRLYAYLPYLYADEEPAIHVIDTETLSLVGDLPGQALAIDVERNRLFVGEPLTFSTPDDAPGVRIIDGATLETIDEIDQPGSPVYNPERNELLIIAYTVYTADADTGQITGDLFPELEEQAGGIKWCNSCVWADEAWYLPEQGLVGIQLSAHCAGKGCGVREAPRFYAAATMEPLPTTQAPAIQANCGSDVMAVGAIDGRIYQNQIFDRYVVYTNFRVYDASGAPVTWRDGLSTTFINPTTRQGYRFDGMVFDLETLEPIGQWPNACIFAYDPESGLLYGRRENNLFVIAERGAAAELPVPVDQPPPESWVIGVHASPDFAADGTLLAEIDEGEIYRSTDSGTSWVRLRGGLPEGGDSLRLHVYFSPAYATDPTLYATGYRSEYGGEGVWRSMDGGDTWEPLWDTLTHLRGEQLYFAPDFAANPTLVLEAKFNDLANGVSGRSFQQSTDGGLSWTVVVTGGYYAGDHDVPLPPVSELLPGSDQTALPVRIAGFDDAIQYTLDGANWQTATVTIETTDWLFALVPAPQYPADPTIYAVAHHGIWRTTDGGATWAQWNEPQYADADNLTKAIYSATVTPVLNDGSHRLVLGTGEGRVLLLDPDAMAWEPLAAPAAQAQPDAGPTLPTPTPLPLTEAEPLTGEPPAGLFRPEGSFAAMWENTARIQQDLGWAKSAGPDSYPGAFQRFDGGVMVWVQEGSRVFVIFNDGTWQRFTDTWQEGEPERDPAIAVPAGKLQPIRGFGKLWRQVPSVREQLGWALAKEEAVGVQEQIFERGSMIRIGGLAYTLVGTGEEGKWY
ncbi:MAG: hypothetical protein H3C34_10090 [Caldilineaceae bacterium]|nr:hypothetical protein [Caldilineaceae bacterium]